MPNKSSMDPSCVALLADATKSEYDKSKSNKGSPNCAHEEAGGVESTLPKLWDNGMKPNSARSKSDTNSSMLANASTSSINSSCAGLLNSKQLGAIERSQFEQHPRRMGSNQFGTVQQVRSEVQYVKENVSGERNLNAKSQVQTRTMLAGHGSK